MDRCALLIFPHQLFAEHPGIAADPDQIVMVEADLFFGDPRYTLRFHQQKLWFHRATMQRYALALTERDLRVEYVEHQLPRKAIEVSLDVVVARRCSEVIALDPHDDLLQRRVERGCARRDLTIRWLPTPMFLNSAEQNQSYRAGKKRWFMADFYKHQRKRLNVLMVDGKPQGGKWSLDEDNRKKVPKKMLQHIPQLEQLKRDAIDTGARDFVRNKYPDNPGRLDELIYPTSHAEAERWLQRFFEHRFDRFGDYEDALVQGQSFLWHSVLSPMLNTGLLTPQQVVHGAIEAAQTRRIPLNSLEGFVRQIIGWREFIRATYQDLGRTMRRSNHWEHRRDIPQSFYEGTTGIVPVDDVISRVLKTGYCHHIERLMVLGGFMFVCEFEPDQIYTWFMELFVDSYDWVMVPNVYAMSQHADGGLITTKPYFSGSAYIRKMGNYPPGQWTAIWDGLYWRWIHKNIDRLSTNRRWAMMCALARKMDSHKRRLHLERAENFLSQL